MYEETFLKGNLLTTRDALGPAGIELCERLLMCFSNRIHGPFVEGYHVVRDELWWHEAVEVRKVRRNNWNLPSQPSIEEALGQVSA